jgi:hypothetical protein
MGLTSKQDAVDLDGGKHDWMHFVFPIMKYFPKDETYQPVGTGFFISSIGLFVTARHVIADLLEQDGTIRSVLVATHLLSNGERTLRSVERFFVHDVTDIAIGFLKPTAPDGTTPIFNYALRLALYWPLGPQKVRSVSFPNTIRAQHDETEIIILDMLHASGELTMLHRKGRDRAMLRGPCYETSLQIYGGSSGGPVFDERGRVFGIHSTGFDNLPVSYIVPVSEIMDIRITGVQLNTGQGTDISISELAERGLVAIDAY